MTKFYIIFIAVILIYILIRKKSKKKNYRNIKTGGSVLNTNSNNDSNIQISSLSDDEIEFFINQEFIIRVYNRK